MAEVARRARKRAESWTDVPRKWSSLGDGLEQTFAEARAAFQAASDEPTVDALHEWRKQAKYLRDQLEFVRPLWKPRITKQADEADRLGSLLGDDHDLAVLERRLATDSAEFGDGASVEVVLGAAGRRLGELRQEAFLLGRRFFVERPKKFARQFQEY